MEHTPREVFEEDPTFEEGNMSPTTAAYQCGLQGIEYLGIWTEGTNRAYLRGRSARTGYPIIDEIDAPPLTSETIAKT